MRRLTGAQRRHLRGMAHHLRPIVHMGKAGLSDAAVAGIDDALGAHELIKVRLVDHAEDRRELAAALEERLGCEVVGIVGHVMIVFRRNPDPDRHVLKLPFEIEG